MHVRDTSNNVSISCNKFKVFLYKNLEDSCTFIANIWSKLKRDSQYQLEDLQDGTSLLEHLQSIFQEVDLVEAPEETHEV